MDNSTDRVEAFREMVVVEGVASDPRQKFLGKEFALLDRYELQDALVDTLQQTVSHRHRVEALLNCHRTFRGWTCRNGHGWANAEKSCSLRICPHCCRSRSTEVARKLEPFLATKPKNSLRYMVLSERNCTDLAEGLRSIWAAFGKLRRTVGWKRKVRGCVVAFEVTVRPNGEWHPHLNILIEGEYYPQEAAAQAWVEATGGRGEIVWVSAVDAGTSRELIKYVTKMSDLVGNPEALEIFLNAVYNRRLFRTYGSFFRLKLEEVAEGKPGTCPDCGTDEIVRLGVVRPQQVCMDFKGTLRVKRRTREVDREVAESVDFSPSTPRQKPVNYIPIVKKRWDKEGKEFEARHEDLVAAADSLGMLRVDTVEGWGFSQFLKGLRQPAA